MEDRRVGILNVSKGYGSCWPLGAVWVVSHPKLDFHIRTRLLADWVVFCLLGTLFPNN